MKTFTVHLPAGTTGTADMAERAVFIRDGFAWWALFIPFFWLLWHRLWIALAIFVSISVIIGIAGEQLPHSGPAVLVLGLAVNFMVAFEGNEMRRWKLARKGYELAGIVSGRNIEDAELRFFDEAVGDARISGAAPTQSQVPAPAVAARPVPSSFAPSDPDVIGLFPRPGSTR